MKYFCSYFQDLLELPLSPALWTPNCSELQGAQDGEGGRGAVRDALDTPCCGCWYLWRCTGDFGLVPFLLMCSLSSVQVCPEV